MMSSSSRSQVAAQPQGAVAGGVDLHEFLAGRYEFPTGRKVRTLDVLAELLAAVVSGLLQQPHQRRDDFAQVVRRNVGGHADGNAAGTVQQQVRQLGRQAARAPVACRRNSAPTRPFPGRVRPAVRPRRASVAPRCNAWRRRTWDRPWIPSCPGHQRWVAIGEGLGHVHHGLVARGIAVGMKLADHVTDGPGGLLVLAGGRSPSSLIA